MMAHHGDPSHVGHQFGSWDTWASIDGQCLLGLWWPSKESNKSENICCYWAVFLLRNIILCHSVSVVALTVREISAVKNCSWHRRLTSIADWPVTIYTACWLGNECVNDLPKVLLGVERLGAKPVTHDLLVASLGCWTVPGYNAERVTVVCDCCFFPVIPPIIMSYLEKGAFLKVSCSWCQWHLDSFDVYQ